MPSITKPLIPLSPLPKNDLGLTIRDYEGQMSTLCAGCGHDSVTAAIVHAFWELSTPPHMIAKLSGIGRAPARSGDRTSRRRHDRRHHDRQLRPRGS